METNLNRRLMLIGIKYIPWIMALLYFICILLTCFGITFIWLNYICNVSILSLVLMLLLSKALNFCIWHRLPIYYCATLDISNTVYYYTNIPILNSEMLLIYLFITGLFVLLGAYLKNKHNEHEN